MIGLTFSFLVAFFESIKIIFSKKSLKHIDEYTAAWSLRFFALIFLLPILFFTGIPQLKPMFWYALIISGILNTIAPFLYMKALKITDISLAIPLMAFTPLFLLITSPLITKEFPTYIGLIGVLIIFIGTYIINFKNKKLGLLDPIKEIFRNKGQSYILIVAFLYSISSNFDKIGVLNSSAVFWPISVITFSTIVFSFLIYKKKKNLYKNLSNYYQFLIPIGFFSALVLFFQMNALKYSLVVYVISIKRFSIVLAVIFSWLFFKEKSIKYRLLGTIISFIGILFISYTLQF